MRQSLHTFIVVIVLVSGGSGQSVLEEQVRENVASLVDTYLHSNPELSYFEQETAAFLAGELRQLGFSVREQVGDYRVEGRVLYGIVGVLENGDVPTVLVRTEIDGLPATESTRTPYGSKISARDENGNEVGVMRVRHSMLR